MALDDYVPEALLLEINKLGPGNGSIVIPAENPEITIQGTPTQPELILHGEDTTTIIYLAKNYHDSEVAIRIKSDNNGTKAQRLAAQVARESGIKGAIGAVYFRFKLRPETVREGNVMIPNPDGLPEGALGELTRVQFDPRDPIIHLSATEVEIPQGNDIDLDSPEYRLHDALTLASISIMFPGEGHAYSGPTLDSLLEDANDRIRIHLPDEGRIVVQGGF